MMIGWLIADMNAELNVSGGVGPYTYQWDMLAWSSDGGSTWNLPSVDWSSNSYPRLDFNNDNGCYTQRTFSSNPDVYMKEMAYYQPTDSCSSTNPGHMYRIRVTVIDSLGTEVVSDPIIIDMPAI